MKHLVKRSPLLAWKADPVPTDSVHLGKVLGKSQNGHSYGLLLAAHVKKEMSSEKTDQCPNINARDREKSKNLQPHTRE